MKKVILVVLVAGFVSALALPQAWGQEKKAQFSLNAGVQSNVFQGTSFDGASFTLDARVGVALGKSFEISPEVMFVLDGVFEGDVNFFYPGVMLNYKAGNFFLGAGAVLPIAFGDGESDTGNIAPKINIGYKYGKVMFTIYAIAWTESDIDFLDMNFIGATIGYKF